MHIEAEKKLFTVHDLHRMAEAGIFGPDERVELIDGEIIQMTSPSPRHVACVNRANALFTEAFGRRAIVSIQNPLRLNLYNEPQPDIVVLRPRPDFYASINIAPEHTYFVVEVSNTTLPLDLKVKLPRYAKFGAMELWIEDLQHDQLLVFRDPKGEEYQTHLALAASDSISPVAFSDVVFRVRDLLGL